MNKALKLIAIYIVALSGTACINTSTNIEKTKNKVINQFSSGLEINTGSIPLQILNDSFEVTPDDGLVLNQTVEVFKLNNGECLSLVTLYNESGFGGYEDLLVFKDSKITTSLQRNLFFSNENGAVMEADIEYDDNVDNSEETQNILIEDFNRYKQKFNSKVISACK